MNGLTFAEPNWLWGGLLLLPLLLLRLLSHLRTARQLPGLVSPRLAHRLVNGAGQARRWAVFVLQSLAVACLFAALARPQMGYEEIETEFDARNLLLAIDTSRSMMADDLAPNRLSRAKLAAKDIVLSLPDDRIGLIAFAGKPFLQAPLTVDHEAVLEAIDQLDTETIPRGGTNLSAAVALAIETVEEAKLGPSALVLFSDGEALEGLGEIEKIRERAAGAGLSLLAVGVGTAEGAIIPETDDAGQILPGVFVKDENGQVVRTRLTTEALRALAANGGAFFHLGGAASLTQVVEQIRRGIASSREDGETTRRPIERFLWPLAAAAILLVLSHLVPLLWLKPVPARRRTVEGRKRVVAILAILLAGVHATSSAADPLSGGQASFAREDYAEALARYESSLGETRSKRARGRLQMGIGAAAYRLGDFERAAEAYGAALAEGNADLRGTAHYNLGNTLFRRGETALASASQEKQDADAIRSLSDPGEVLEQTIREWEGAVEHFESSLALAPGNAQAAHNLDYVRKRLEELKEQKEREEEEQEQEKQQEQKQQNEEDKEQDKEQGSDPKDSDGSRSQDPQDSSGDPQKDPSEENGDPKEENSKDSSQKPEEGNPEGPEESGDSESPEKDGESPQPPPASDPSPPQEPENSGGDGQLEANPNQSQPQPNQAGAAEAQPHPQTGYSPTEARQLLDALADETEVRPVLPPAKNEKFKNW